MNLAVRADVQQLVAAELLSQARRPLRLKLGRDNRAGADLLLQRIDVQEALNDGIGARIGCLSARSDLPLKSFIGQPVEIQIVTDRGQLRRICAIVTGAKVGQSDGSLTVYELQAEDALAVMARRINSRIFRGKSDLQVVDILTDEWRQRSAALASAFRLVRQGMDPDRYPQREFIHQFNESDADFIRRLLGRSGICWFFRPDGADGDTPAHEMVLFDRADHLHAYTGGAVRYHRDDATEQRDAITGIVFARDLTAGAVARSTADYKAGRMTQSGERSALDLGDIGNSLAGLLEDAQIEMPHAADSGRDHARRTRSRIERHDMQARCLHGESGVRDLAVGERIRIDGHPEIDAHPPEQRHYVVVELHHRAESNLPKELDAQAQLLSGDGGHTRDDERRYGNRFRAVRADTPIAPPWNPREQLPATHPITVLVVGPPGEEVHTDELGRVKVQFPGYRSEDHAHAGGAGTRGDDRDSAWVRVVTSLAGPRFGVDFIPRVGMEAQVVFQGNDPDKPVIVGVIHNGPNAPAAWSDVGGLPGNRYVSGIKTREIFGGGFNQLRYDDTPGQISLQWSTSHAATQINGGFLTHPRSEGRGDPRGEGLEARTDGHAALRGGRGVYVTAQPQARAGGDMLERQALIGLAGQLQGIVERLADAASTHHAEDTDAARLRKIVAQLQHWDGGTNVDAHGAGGGAPMVAIDGPAGIAIASQDNLLLGAQSHIDAVSAGNTQLSAGRRLLLRAADLFSAFARRGIKLIAAEGKLQIEAHQDDIELTAARRIVLSAGDEIVLQAPKIRFIAQGTQVDHGGGRIVEQSQSLHHIMSPDFSVGGAGGGSPGLSTPRSSLATDERFVLRLRGTGAPVADRAYRLTLGNGQVIEGRTDAQGRTSLSQSDAMHVADVQVLDT